MSPIAFMSDDEVQAALAGLALVADFIETFTPVHGQDADYGDARARALKVLAYEAQAWRYMSAAGTIILQWRKAGTN